MTITCRNAHERDIDAMAEMIDFYAQKGIMLPRSKNLLQRQIEDFVVAEDEEGLIGCGSLCLLSDDLGEIRSLGIKENNKGRGAGKQLLQILEQKAKERQIKKLMALTYEVSFFEKNGFQVVSMSIFPEKVWTDCVFCKKQDRCDEIAVLKVLH